MCKSCDRPHPNQDECFKLFYRHDGVLYRAALPRSMFKRTENYTIYHHPDRVNKPVTVFKHNKSVEVIGFGQRQVGAIFAIMDGKEPKDWYHRPKRNNFLIGKDLLTDKDEEDDFRQYPRIPEKIYKNGFLTLRMRTR